MTTLGKVEITFDDEVSDVMNVALSQSVLQFVRSFFVLDDLFRQNPSMAWAIRDATRSAKMHEILVELSSVYRERNHCVALIARMAQHMGLRAAIYEALDEPGWFLVFINLPTGQVSWHIPESDLDLFTEIQVVPTLWDRHDTVLKYQRVRDAFLPPATNSTKNSAKN